MPSLLLGGSAAARDGQFRALATSQDLSNWRSLLLKVGCDDLRIGLYLHLQQPMYALVPLSRFWAISWKESVAIDSDYSQCLPGTATVTSQTTSTSTASTSTPPTSTVTPTTTTSQTTTSTGSPTTTSTGATPTGSQIRAVEDPVFHFYLQDSGQWLFPLIYFGYSSFVLQQEVCLSLAPKLLVAISQLTARYLWINPMAPSSTSIWTLPERHLISPSHLEPPLQPQIGVSKATPSSPQLPGNSTLLHVPRAYQLFTISSCKMAMTLHRARVARFKPSICLACARYQSAAPVWHHASCTIDLLAWCILSMSIDRKKCAHASWTGTLIEKDSCGYKGLIITGKEGSTLP